MRKRTGTLIMAAGVLLAVLAGLMVLGMTRQARAERIAQVKQVLVVMAADDIADGSAVSASQLTMQAFPADFVPQGAIAAPDDAIGKYTTTHITKGQIVLSNQLSSTKVAGELALSVPSGKEAVALPMSDLMSVYGGIKAGDHVDVLLTLDLKEIQIKSTANGPAPVAASDSNAKNPVTQTTLQDVEVLAVGKGLDSQANTGTSSATTAGAAPSGTVQGAVILLLDPQDALVLKWAKDSGGIVDLALRSPDDSQQNKTDPVTIDHMFERFNFQVPGPVP